MGSSFQAIVGSALLFAAATTAQAASLTVQSYDMLNGTTGTYHYWDALYTGSGSTLVDAAPLSGGTGALTDGLTAPLSWFNYGGTYPNGPYVGWALDPTITFHFGSNVTINSVTLYLDDAAGVGGVSPPTSVVIDGTTYSGGAGVSGAPYALTISGLSLTEAQSVITLNRSDVWVFASEISFDGVPSTATPEPASLALIGFGLTAIGLLRRRRAN